MPYHNSYQQLISKAVSTFTSKDNIIYHIKINVPQPQDFAFAHGLGFATEFVLSGPITITITITCIAITITIHIISIIFSITCIAMIVRITSINIINIIITIIIIISHVITTLVILSCRRVLAGERERGTTRQKAPSEPLPTSRNFRA